MKLVIAISSGKGGTGKTFISTNIARVIEKMGEKVRYLDCDVEEPNGHLFLKPKINHTEDVMLLSPMGVDEAVCTSCGKCVKACNYNALLKYIGELLKNKEIVSYNHNHTFYYSVK
ncbi:MAG: P-loop NTPase [Spirochaetales bacterium]|nr:P-loop NTPase [Spirochaetales bacterium]